MEGLTSTLAFTTERFDHLHRVEFLRLYDKTHAKFSATCSIHAMITTVCHLSKVIE